MSTESSNFKGEGAEIYDLILLSIENERLHYVISEVANELDSRGASITSESYHSS